MIQGIDINDTIDFVSQFDKDKDNPTTFTIGIIDIKTKFRLIEKAEKDESVNEQLEVIKAGLKGIKNLKVKGELVNFSKIDDDVLNKIPMQVIHDIYRKIIEVNFLSENEKKN